jgi:hypothetical protein
MNFLQARMESNNRGGGFFFCFAFAASGQWEACL